MIHSFPRRARCLLAGLATLAAMTAATGNAAAANAASVPGTTMHGAASAIPAPPADPVASPLPGRATSPAADPAAATPGTASTSAPADAGTSDPVLANNAVTQIRRSDYNAELLRLPPDQRAGFANDPKRVLELLSRMLTTRTLALQAKDLGIDQDPEVQKRVQVEVERFLAKLRVARVETDAAKYFDAHRAEFEARARELYATNAKAYAEPAQVSASHILFSLDKHSREEGEKLAREWRARILAGEDFNEVAKKVSDDPSAAANAGRLGWFTSKVMDPAFSEAAFKLQHDGDISEPVLSRFGWHLIRRDGFKPAQPRSYEEVRDKILDEVKQKYVAEKRDEFAQSVASMGGTLHEKEVGALLPPSPDGKSLRQAVPQGAAEPRPAEPTALNRPR
jgi:peptidyl-prolyl cis-trans isomerase C